VIGFLLCYHDSVFIQCIW